MTTEYKVEDLFKPIPGDPDNVNLVIPPEIYEAQGWLVGDKLKVEVGDMGTVIITKVDDTK
tara:strand:+ start:714 stop:896 length:183 start_codon:yes stop_codon:yes gene_type:complete